jgi:tRNA A37 methylthiotransferase MiaB
MAFLFAYSMRERTHAHRRMQDNVPEAVKKERLTKMIETFKKVQLKKQLAEVGVHHLVLVDGNGRLGPTQMTGLTDTNKRAVFPQSEVKPYQVGDYVVVKVNDAS